MADVISGVEGKGSGLTVAGPQRGGAFRDAGRHTSRVRFMRRAIAVSSVLGVAAIIGIAMFDPFKSLPSNFSVGAVGLSGTRITMDSPKMNGYRKDGRPYEVRASKGVQDIRKPTIIELESVDAKVAMGDETMALVTALEGVYDSSRDFMTLKNDVRIQSRPRYDMRLSSAEMDFKQGSLVSKEPVTVLLNNGTIAADTVNMTDNGAKITFEGNVKSLMNSGEPEQPAGVTAVPVQVVPVPAAPASPMQISPDGAATLKDKKK